MSEKHLIYMDLQRTPKEGIILLDTYGTQADLKRFNINLEKDLELYGWQDDLGKNGEFDPLIFKIKIDFDENFEKWIGKFSEEDIRHYSDFLAANSHDWDSEIERIKEEK